MSTAISRSEPGFLRKSTEFIGRYFQLQREQFHDHTEFVQASINLSFVLVYAACWSMYVVLYFFILNNTNAGLMCALAGVPSSLGGAFLIKKYRRFKAAGIVANVGGGITLIGITAATGGVYSPIPAWLFFLTMTAFLCNGRRLGLVIVGMNILGVLGVGAASMLGHIPGTGFHFPVDSASYMIFIMWVYVSSIAALCVVTMLYDYLVRRAFLEAHKAQKKTEAKNRDIRAILKNISSGIFTITKDGVIHEDYSDYLAKFLGKADLAGKNALETVFHHSRLGVNDFDQMVVAVNHMLGDNEMQFDANLHCLPKEMAIKTEEGDRLIEIDWDPILDQNRDIDKILVSIKDVTDQRELKRLAEQQQEELDMMKELVEIEHDRFVNLFQTAEKFIEENKLLISANASPKEEVVKMLFINMHTIKGDARTLHLSKIVNKAHETENRYASLRRNDAEGLWKPNEMNEELDHLMSWFEMYRKIAMEKLGRKDDTLRVDLDKAELRHRIERLEAIPWHLLSLEHQTNISELISYLKAGTYHHFDQLLRELAGNLPRLARDLGKDVPFVELHCPDDILLTDETVQVLRRIFVHMLRNTMDHGIESPELRRQLQKPGQGKVTFQVEEVDRKLHLLFADDGRGLNIRSIQDKGMKAGLCQADTSLEELASLIFTNGFSTADHVDEISGRGVGMDAVEKYLASVQAGIRLQLHPEKAIEDKYMPFSFLIVLHDHLWTRLGSRHTTSRLAS